jgi:succinyl-diaminopimelate desuccinylase
VERDNPFVQALSEAVSRVASHKERISVGRHGASDAICFLDAGIPAVEFGPAGDGHHGPEEWVSIRSLEEYRKALVEFVGLLPERIRGEGEGERRLRIA